MIITTLFRILATTIAIISMASAALGQFGSTTGTGGTTGTGSTTGTSSTGQNSAGGASSGQSGGTGGLQSLSGNSSFAGVVPGESTATSNATETFIGSSATSGFVGGTSQAGNQQSTNRQFQALQNNQSQQSMTQQSGTAREVRTTLRVGFTFPSASQAQINGSVNNPNIASLHRFSPIRPELAGIEVALNSSGIAVLTGSAPTVETRRLAANLIRLQPGIRKVENQIVVQAN